MWLQDSVWQEKWMPGTWTNVYLCAAKVKGDLAATVNWRMTHENKWVNHIKHYSLNILKYTVPSMNKSYKHMPSGVLIQLATCLDSSTIQD